MSLKRRNSVNFFEFISNVQHGGETRCTASSDKCEILVTFRTKYTIYIHMFDTSSIMPFYIINGTNVINLLPTVSHHGNFVGQKEMLKFLSGLIVFI